MDFDQMKAEYLCFELVAKAVQKFYIYYCKNGGKNSFTTYVFML